MNNEVYKKVKDYSKNRNDLSTYYNVGKLLVEAQGGESRAKYGDNLIKEYSDKLTNEIGKGYTVSALKRMRKFYSIIRKGATLSHHLMWSHYVELLKFDDVNKINYYVDILVKQNLSVRELRYKIKNREYDRLSIEVREKLINNEKNKVNDFIKNPILIRNSYNYTKITEKILEQLIIEDLDSLVVVFLSLVSQSNKLKLGIKK